MKPHPSTLPMNPVRSLTPLIAAMLLAGKSLAAGDTDAAPPPTPAAPASAPAADPRGDDEIHIREIFSSHLPETLKKNSLRLWVHPHLGDFSLRDYLRVSSGVRYGVLPHWEIGAGSNFYFSHGVGDVGLFRRYGAADFTFGTKVNLGDSVLPGWKTAVGADLSFPVSSPPAEITDGLRHLAPFVTFSRRLEDRPAVRLFWGFGYDRVEHTRFPGLLRKNQLDDDSLRANAGFVYDHGHFHYTFEAEVATTRIVGSSNEDVVTLRPGILWEIPGRSGAGKSNWVVGAALRASEGPDGLDLGASAKFRLNFDLKRLLGRHPSVH